MTPSTTLSKIPCFFVVPFLHNYSIQKNNLITVVNCYRVK